MAHRGEDLTRGGPHLPTVSALDFLSFNAVESPLEKSEAIPPGRRSMKRTLGAWRVDGSMSGVIAPLREVKRRGECISAHISRRIYLSAYLGAYLGAISLGAYLGAYISAYISAATS